MFTPKYLHGTTFLDKNLVSWSVIFVPASSGAWYTLFDPETGRTRLAAEGRIDEAIENKEFTIVVLNPVDTLVRDLKRNGYEKDSEGFFKSPRGYFKVKIENDGLAGLWLNLYTNPAGIIERIEKIEKVLDI